MTHLVPSPTLPPAVHAGRLARAAGYRVEILGAVTSTNDIAMMRAKEGDPGDIWIVGRVQAGGRGRHGRVWSSPPGNLYASLLLIDAAPPARAAELGFVAGVALAEAASALAGGAAQLQLKWPNDLVHQGAKLSGLLLEAAQLANGRFACVMGFGVNCGSHPDGLPYPASDLTAVLGRSVPPAEMFEALSDCLVVAVDLWRGAGGFEAIRRAWLGHAAGLGTVIRARTGSQHSEGVFETIDSAGRLVLRTPSDRLLIEAGDVFL